MGLLEQILKLAKKNPEVIIAVLLGIIVVGSVGGGLWINALQSTLTERDALVQERLKLIDERYKTNLYLLSGKVSNIDTKFNQLKQDFQLSSSTIIGASQKLDSISSDPQISDANRSSLSAMSRQLSTAVSKIDSDITALDEHVGALSKEVAPFKNYGLPPAALFAPNLLITVVLTIVISVIIFFGLFRLSLFRRRE